MKLLQEALARHSQEVEACLASSGSFGIVLLDDQHAILDCNTGFMRLFGQWQKPLGTPLVDFLDLAEGELQCGEELRLTCSRKSGMNGLFYGQFIRTERGYLLLCERLVLTESRVLEQIGVLNNELISLQRELVKKTHLLENMKLELDEKLEKRTQHVEQLENHQRIILNTMPIGAGFLWGRVIQLANPAFDRILGYEEGETRGMDFASFYTDCAAGERIEKEGRPVLVTGNIYTADAEMRRKDGTVIWCNLIAQAVSPAQPEDGTIWMLRDITERRLAGQALAQAATEWNAAIDASDDVIYLLNLERRLLRANKAFYQLIGLSPEASAGAHIADLLHLRKSKMLCPVCHAQDEQQDAVIILEEDHPVNPVGYPVEIMVSVIRDQEGRPISILTKMHDLTHSRRAQEEKARLEMQLVQAQKMEAIGQLAGGIAHDFNNMLTAIIGYGNLLEIKLEKNSELKPFVEQILSSAEKSANLTRQLLAFSRKQPIEPRITDLNDLLRGVGKLLLRLIGEDVELRIEPAAQPLIVMVDPGQIEQVLINLATNARDAMPGGGLLTIHTDMVVLDESHARSRDVRKAGLYAALVVTDTGEGMEEKALHQIFEPFYTTKELGKGTGLGLSIVYGIMKQHGGSVAVESCRGKGTTFTLYLPLVAPGPAAEDVTETELPEGGTETILVAEDDEIVRSLSRKLLETRGYQVIEAVDGEDAVEQFLRYQEVIALALVDVIMPKMSGKEAVDAMRKLRPDLPVLFMSGYTSDIISKKGILEEDMDFIPKPVTSYRLLAKLREMLDQKAMP